jgi:hypothetical protein
VQQLAQAGRTAGERDHDVYRWARHGVPTSSTRYSAPIGARMRS